MEYQNENQQVRNLKHLDSYNSIVRKWLKMSIKMDNPEHSNKSTIPSVTAKYWEYTKERGFQVLLL